MLTAKSPAKPAENGRDAGFSLVEVLIAAALLLIVSVGILPMFTRSITNNLQGKQATEATNLARSELERMIQLPSDAADLTLLSGTELVRNEKWSKNSLQWYDVGSFPTGEIDAFERTVTVRQFGMGALADGLLDSSELLDASSDPQLVHLKEIEVEVVAPPSGMSPGKQVTLRVFKAL